MNSVFLAISSLDSALTPQQERWCLRSSRLTLCNNPIVALTWWAISAQYWSLSIISCTFLRVHWAFLILSESLDWYVDMRQKEKMQNPMVWLYCQCLIQRHLPSGRFFSGYLPQDLHPLHVHVVHLHGLHEQFFIDFLIEFIPYHRVWLL